MASPLGKAKLALRNPDLIAPYLRHRWLQWRAADPTEYVVSLDGYDLAVDLSDKGIGKDLALDGEREPLSTAAYRRALRALAARVDGPVRVAEIGANIGYYALIPPTVLNDVVVYAAEVDPDNVALLRRNVARNDAADRVYVDCLALGATDGTTEYHRSSRSNWHTLNDATVAADPARYDAVAETPVCRGETWMGEYDLSPADIDAVRMDVEGYEAEVFRGLGDVFAAGPTLLHMELHPRRLSAADADYLHERLEGLDLALAARDGRAIDATTVDDLFDYPWVEVVAWA